MRPRRIPARPPPIRPPLLRSDQFTSVSHIILDHLFPLILRNPRSTPAVSAPRSSSCPCHPAATPAPCPPPPLARLTLSVDVYFYVRGTASWQVFHSGHAVLHPWMHFLFHWLFARPLFTEYPIFIPFCPNAIAYAVVMSLSCASSSVSVLMDRRHHPVAHTIPRSLFPTSAMAFPGHCQRSRPPRVPIRCYSR